MGEIINNVIWSRDNIPNPQSLYEVVNYDFRTMLCRTFSEELCIRNVMASDEGRYRCNFTLNNEPRFAADVCFRVLGKSNCIGSVYKRHPVTKFEHGNHGASKRKFNHMTVY